MASCRYYVCLIRSQSYVESEYAMFYIPSKSTMWVIIYHFSVLLFHTMLKKLVYVFRKLFRDFLDKRKTHTLVEGYKTF